MDAVKKTTGGTTPTVSVLTPSIRGREAYLAECEQSVRGQTMSAWEHLVLIDEKRAGCAVTMNKLANAAQAEWLLPLADDDILLPRCLQLLLAHAESADIIYAPPLVWWEPGVAHAPDWFCQAPPVIPSFALIRAETWRDLGGYREDLVREEDRHMWIAALEQGKRFVRASDDPTWVYRHHSGNKSFNGGIAA